MSYHPVTPAMPNPDSTAHPTKTITNYVDTYKGTHPNAKIYYEITALDANGDATIVIHIVDNPGTGTGQSNSENQSEKMTATIHMTGISESKATLALKVRQGEMNAMAPSGAVTSRVTLPALSGAPLTTKLIREYGITGITLVGTTNKDDKGYEYTITTTEATTDGDHKVSITVSKPAFTTAAGVAEPAVAKHLA